MSQTYSKAKDLTNGGFLKRSWGHLGRNWDCATSCANEYSCILKVSVGPWGVLATLRYGAVSVFDNIRKCVTPIGPETFKKSLRLFRFFSCNQKTKIQTWIQQLQHKLPYCAPKSLYSSQSNFKHFIWRIKGDMEIMHYPEIESCIRKH